MPSSFFFRGFLLHELAHVRRWDCLVNLLQRTVEALLFFHPMTWWLSAWVRLERESCCDRVVIARTGKPRAYAETLAALALAGPALRTGALAMNEHGLVTRIRRILNLEDRSMKISTKSLVFGALFLCAAVAVVSLYSQETPREPEGAAQNEVLPTQRASNLPGQVQAFEQVDLHARVSGFVEKISVDIGDRVKKGQVLAEVAVPELDAELRQREAQVLQAKAGINQVHGSAKAAQAALASVKLQVD